MDAGAWCRRDGGGWLLAIHARPGAKKSAVAGVHGDALKVALAAAPVEGRANEELIRFLAQALGVPRSALSLEGGASSKRKTVRLRRADIDPHRLLEG